MKKVRVEDAVGMVLMHDITEVDLDRNFKGRAFKKGHIICADDVEKLKKLGKDYVYVMDISEDEIHENEAAVMLADAIMGENTYRDESPVEGKINIYSKVFGVVKVDIKKLLEFNSVGEPSCPTIHSDVYVNEGTRVASVRIISLVAKRREVMEAVKIADGGIVRVVPFVRKSVGMIITGNEIYYGRIPDKFYDRLKPKLEFFKAFIADKVVLPDDEHLIRDKIVEFAGKFDMVILTGGTSVDPDDVTYKAIKGAGAQDFVRGNPIQPGNMLSMGWLNGKPVVAVPAAALFYRATSFDIWLPRLLIGERIKKEDIVLKSHGGLCYNCPVCVYPVCPFGKSFYV